MSSYSRTCQTSTCIGLPDNLVKKADSDSVGLCVTRDPAFLTSSQVISRVFLRGLQFLQQRIRDFFWFWFYFLGVNAGGES